MKASNERRKTTRLTIETAVVISDKNQNKITGKIQNLSTIGALIKTNEQLKRGTQYWITIQLQGHSSTLSINNLKATVVRYDTGTIAITFSDTMEWLTLFYVYRQKLKLDKAYNRKLTSKKNCN